MQTRKLKLVLYSLDITSARMFSQPYLLSSLSPVALRGAPALGWSLTKLSFRVWVAVANPEFQITKACRYSYWLFVKGGKTLKGKVYPHSLRKKQGELLMFIFLQIHGRWQVFKKSYFPTHNRNLIVLSITGILSCKMIACPKVLSCLLL